MTERGLVGVGYEGRTIDEFVADLVQRGISRVVDVRLTPVSRKPGFSKNALQQELADRGIAYEHRPELGNPPDNRPGFGGNALELSAARAAYAMLLRRPEAAAALDDLVEIGGREAVAVLCFEADEERCHRHVILRAALGSGLLTYDYLCPRCSTPVATSVPDMVGALCSRCGTEDFWLALPRAVQEQIDAALREHSPIAALHVITRLDPPIPLRTAIDLAAYRSDRSG
jgi:Domain of unknown function DUF488